MVYRLACHLKAIPGLVGAGEAVLRAIVQEWHRLALPYIETKSLSTTWSDFLRAWSSVREGPVDEALRLCVGLPPHPRTVDLYPTRPGARLLVLLCRQLHDMVGEFWLSGPTVARVLGISPSHAWKLLKALCDDGFLEVVQVGKLDGRQASQYRYLSL